MKRGYGCDGIDNTCDKDGSVDECGEDIFPPDLDLSIASQECGNKIHASTEDGINCIASHAKAEDDCLPVSLSVSTLPGTSHLCNPTAEVKAVANGCNNRDIEDTT